ncbi:serine hydrolase domain-containing protein [Paenibacillus caui]|uniref:serine hydrolase domain-containing protein n=1 Tax=Paenibacillus caui TaxID=2873927 RepID=UPI001CA9D21D|nr:serine hydrolase [Paenibacillus caui]
MSLSRKIEEMIKQHNENSPFSGAVLVQQNELKIFEESFGYANRSERIHNSVNTRLGIASGCKIFTAVAICQLVQDGVLTFDSYLSECLDIPFPDFDPNITIHHLLTHSSGIPDYFDEETMSDFEELWKTLPMYTIQSPKDFLPMFQNKPMKFTPGEKFAYCNSGFILLGMVVEQLTGLDFTTYVEQNIFQRCGMLDSGYFRMDQLPERTALGYIDHEAGWRTNVYSLPIKGGPDGGAYTTVHDLMKFWDALLNNQLLSKKYTDILLTPHIKETDDHFYGYGVWISMQKDQIFKYYVMGSDPGVIMQSSVYAKHKIHAHLIGNINKGAGIIARKIDEIIVKEF